MFKLPFDKQNYNNNGVVHLYIQTTFRNLSTLFFIAFRNIQNYCLQVKNPSVPTYFTNRALCYLKTKQWDMVCTDCRRSLELDPMLVKGHFFLAQALIEMNQYDEAIASFKRGMLFFCLVQELHTEKSAYIGPDITCT